MIVEIPYNKDNLYRWQNPVAGSQNLFWEPRNSTVCRNVVIVSVFYSKMILERKPLTVTLPFYRLAGKLLVDMIKIKAPCSFISYSLVTLAMVSSMCSTVNAKCV